MFNVFLIILVVVELESTLILKSGACLMKTVHNTLIPNNF